MTHPDNPEPVYRGHIDGHTVTVETPGTTTRPLPTYGQHLTFAHSREFAWGYNGSGPAQLAWALLIDALGGAAKCPTCDGTGMTTFDTHCLETLPAYHREESDDLHRYTIPHLCLDCVRGLVVKPEHYQAFKHEVVATWPSEHGWTMTRTQILTWWTAHTTTPH